MRKKNKYQVTLCLCPEYQVVPALGYKIAGVQTSLFSRGSSAMGRATLKCESSPRKVTKKIVRVVMNLMVNVDGKS